MEPHWSEVLPVLLRLAVARRTLPVPLFWVQLHDFKIHMQEKTVHQLQSLPLAVARKGPGVAAAGSVSAATECH